MTEEESISIQPVSRAVTDPDIDATKGETIWRMVEQQPALLSLVCMLILQFIQVSVSRLTGAEEPWIDFSIAVTAKLLALFGFFYALFNGLVGLQRRNAQIVQHQQNLILREAHIKVADIAEQNIRIQKESIEGFAKISEARDFSSGQHIQRMKEYAKVVAAALGRNPKYHGIITEQYIQDIHIAAPLHDIGKVGTKDEILKKRGKLSGEEFELMKMHTIIGGDLMAELEDKLPGTSFFSRGREIAYHHHQRWDGTGYPNILTFGNSVAYFVEPGVGKPLKGDDIPLSARIIALADVYDALRSRRVYKEPFTHETARDMILQERGRHFDPDVVDAFVAIESEILQIALSFKD